jgi:hypothetical protein
VAYLLKARTVRPEKQPLLGNNGGVVKMREVTSIAVAMEQLSKRVSVKTNSRNNIRAVFSVRSVPRGYKKGKGDRFKAVEFRDASLPGYKLGIRLTELRNRDIRIIEFSSVDLKVWL